MRKGITPVIAVVLLLLITVGAVASAWGLYQQITSNTGAVDDLNQIQRAQSTNIRIESVYKDNGYINASLRNNGGEPVNLTRDVELLVAPTSGSNYLSPTLLQTEYSTMGDPRDSGCFGGEGEVLTTEGDTRQLQCNTSIKFPNAGDTVRFRLSYRDVENTNWDFRCSPNSASSIRCD